MNEAYVRTIIANAVMRDDEIYRELLEMLRDFDDNHIWAIRKRLREYHDLKV